MCAGHPGTVQECQSQPRPAPAPTATHAASRTRQLQLSLSPPLEAEKLFGSRKSSDSDCSVPRALPCSSSLLSKAASVRASHGRGGWGRSQNDSHTRLESLELGNSAGQCPAVTQPCLPADVSCNGKLLDRVCWREGSQERPGCGALSHPLQPSEHTQFPQTQVGRTELPLTCPDCLGQQIFLIF